MTTRKIAMLHSIIANCESICKFNQSSLAKFLLSWGMENKINAIPSSLELFNIFFPDVTDYTANLSLNLANFVQL